MCARCGAAFSTKQGASRHAARKRPCSGNPKTEPCARVDGADQAAAERPSQTEQAAREAQAARVERSPRRAAPQHACSRCGRTFSRADNLTRHHKGCAPLEPERGETTRAELAELRAQLAQLMAHLGTTAAAGAHAAGAHAAVTNVNGARNVVVNNIQLAVNVRPWGTEAGRAAVTPAMLNEVFESCSELREYCDMSFRDRLDVEKAAPYAVKGMVELARRAHAAPEAQNIRLNPRRADQVLVYSGEDWSALTLHEGIRAIFDELDADMGRVILADGLRAELTDATESGATGVRTVYGGIPDRVAQEARGQMAAHLGNMAPRRGLHAC